MVTPAPDKASVIVSFRSSAVSFTVGMDRVLKSSPGAKAMVPLAAKFVLELLEEKATVEK